MKCASAEACLKPKWLRSQTDKIIIPQKGGCPIMRDDFYIDLKIIACYNNYMGKIQTIIKKRRENYVIR